MEYYELFQSRKVENPVRIYGPGIQRYHDAVRETGFEALDEVKMAFFSGQESEELSDVLTEPVFLVSEALKMVMELYDREIRFKALQLIPEKAVSGGLQRDGGNSPAGRCPLYRVPLFAEVDCLHPDSVIRENGTVERLVLDGSRTGDRQIFRIGGLKEYRVAISLPVAESILRRMLCGTGIRKLEVRGEV